MPASSQTTTNFSHWISRPGQLNRIGPQIRPAPTRAFSNSVPQALSNCRVYIAFGGLYGDCGAFNGWLVGGPVDGNAQLIFYRVPSHRGAGLWPPSGPAVDGTGNIYVTSGNGFSNSSFDFGNSVIRLSADLAIVDRFAPKTGWS